MPWKNGGGVTNEVLLEPGDGARFIYRLSIADVASSGPFSHFDGYDRHIVVIEGAGMTLDCGAHGTFHLRRYVPQTFSGDWDVTGTLDAGSVRDLNLIVDRARASGSLSVRDVTGTTSFGARGTCILHVLEGRLDEAEAGDTLVTDGELVVSGTATIALANVIARPSSI